MIRKVSWGFLLLLLLIAACAQATTPQGSTGAGDDGPQGVAPGVVYVYKPAT